MTNTINPFFNAPFYLGMNNGLIRAGLNTPDQLWHHYTHYGAYEIADTPDAWRVPNAWFDVTHYLSLHPDLTQNGISAATALDHYYHYGIHEHREINPNLGIDSFTSDAYAEANPDVAAAVGVGNKAGLLKHYLEFGYKEQRDGAGAEWEGEVGAEVMLWVGGVMTGKAVFGTLADDTFMVNGFVRGATIDGLGGKDTVVFNAGTRTGPVEDGKAVTLKHIEKIITNDNVDLDMVMAGQLREMQWVNNGIATVQVDDIHIIHLRTTDTSTSTTLYANRLDGSELVVNINHTADINEQTLRVGSVKSPKLSSIVINGNASQGDLVLEMDSSVAAVKNVVMVGGRGDDVLIASAAMDTLTEGKEADVFDFSALHSVKIGLENKHISALNTITDFGPTNTLKLPATTPLTPVLFQTGDLPADLSLEAVLSQEKVTDYSCIILTAALYAGVVDEGVEVMKCYRGIFLNEEYHSVLFCLRGVSHSRSLAIFIFPNPTKNL